MKHIFNYNWKLSETKFTKDKGTVFSCFACGGGSSFGYKLAGFDVIGMNEIDKKMAECYIANHNPKYSFIEDIRVLKEREDLPKELYELDILDGSPPCSSFSMAGNREKDWGKEKKFREGQAEQVLDTLFFDFIDLAKKLQPKIVIAENVKGILLGEAKEYVKKILVDFDKAGYIVKEFLLDASRMGVPQKRERVFFIAIRKDLAESLPQNETLFFEDFPLLDLVFFENLIKFGDFKDEQGRELSEKMKETWNKRNFGDSDMRAAYYREFKKDKYFSQNFIYENEVPKTITSHEDSLVLFSAPKYTSKDEVCKIGSFPLDYDFRKSKPHYIIGMSVPPIMTAQIASRIYEQWLKRLVVKKSDGKKL